jgi:hypothetical protein
VDEQLKKLETAANANRSEWEAQLKAKLGDKKSTLLLVWQQKNKQCYLLLQLQYSEVKMLGRFTLMTSWFSICITFFALYFYSVLDHLHRFFTNVTSYKC